MLCVCVCVCVCVCGNLWLHTITKILSFTLEVLVNDFNTF